MRILILGGGGLGTLLAGFLARAGETVTLFVKPPQAVTLAGGALRIRGLQEFQTRVNVAVDPAALGAVDYLLVCVKGRDTDAAVAPLRGIPVGSVLSLQNGARKNERLAAVFGHERVLGGLTSVAGSLLSPGQALFTNPGMTIVGELDGSVSERAESLAAAVRASGLPAEAAAGVRTLEWYKLTVFLRTALVCALTRRDIASVAFDPDLAPLCVSIVREVARVAAAEGCALPWGAQGLPLALVPHGAETTGLEAAPDDALLAGLRAMGQRLREQGLAMVPSLAQDVIAERPTELEETAGDVLERAHARAIPAPSLALCVRLLRGLERGRASSIDPRATTEGR